MAIVLEPERRYKQYSVAKLNQLKEYVVKLRQHANNRNTPYSLKTYMNHLNANYHTLCSLVPKDGFVRVEASLLFWLYRSAGALKLPCPLALPHIFKQREGDEEHFYIVSKEEWKTLRDSVLGKPPSSAYSDHAQLQYLARVLHIDIDALMQGAPKVSAGRGKILADGRRSIVIGNHVYIMDGATCVSVLNKGMNIE